MGGYEGCCEAPEPQDEHIRSRLVLRLGRLVDVVDYRNYGAAAQRAEVPGSLPLAARRILLAHGNANTLEDAVRQAAARQAGDPRHQPDQL